MSETESIEFDELPDSAFIRQDALMVVFPFSESQLWRMVRDGQFPRPVKMSPRVTAWKVRDVRVWLAERPLAGGKNPKKQQREQGAAA